MITVTINGRQIVLEGPVTILEAARRAGVVIPTLCHHELLEPYGGCRLCLVEIEKVPRLQTACTQYVADGMVVSTESRTVVEARKAVLEFLLINHPLDCPVCDKAGECELQNAVMRYGAPAGTFSEGKRRIPESLDDPLIVRNMERCISCARCVRMCDQKQGASAIAMVNRSGATCVEPFSGGRFDCEYCGNCLSVCPVGALLSKLHRNAYRAWMVDKEVTTLCPFCGVGCSLTAQVRQDRIVRVVPRQGHGVNRGLLCNRGRFGYDTVSAFQRLTSPLLKKEGELKKVDWDEALRFVAGRLKEIKERDGGTTIGGIASGRCTNEEAHTFQTFFRAVLGSNNIDSTAGLSYAPAREFLEGLLGRGSLTNPLERISASDGIFVIGGDPTSLNPVLGLQIRAASRWGASIVTVGHMPGLRDFQTIPLISAPRADTAILGALVAALRTKRGPGVRRPGLEEAMNSMAGFSLKDAARISGIPEDRLTAAVEALTVMKDPSIIVGADVVRRVQGEANIVLVACLAHLLEGRTYLMADLPNEYGLCDRGCRPGALPGGMPLRNEAWRKACGDLMGITIPAEPGMGIMEMIEAAHSGKLKALYVVREDLLSVLPDRQYVRDALSRLDLLVVQDSFLTETAELADAVLPSLFWAEQEGSYTNIEGRMQPLRGGLQGAGREGWRIIGELASLLGLDMKYRDTGEVLAEITSVTDLQREFTGEDREAGSLLFWGGAPQEVAVDERANLSIGLTNLTGESEGDGQQIYAAADFQLLGQCQGYNYSAVLNAIAPEPYVRLSRALADRLSLTDGDEVAVCAEAGTLRLRVVTDGFLPEQVAMIPLSAANGGLLSITKWRMNPVTKSPVLDSAGIVIKKAGEARGEGC